MNRLLGCTVAVLTAVVGSLLVVAGTTAPAAASPSEASWVGTVTYRSVSIDPTYAARFKSIRGVTLDVTTDADGEYQVSGRLTEWTYQDGATDGSYTCNARLVSADPWEADSTYLGEIGGQLYLSSFAFKTIDITYRHSCPTGPGDTRTQETGPETFQDCPPYEDPSATPGQASNYSLRLGEIQKRAGSTAVVQQKTTRRCTGIFDDEVTQTVTTDLAGSYVDLAESTTSGNLSSVRYRHGATAWLTVTVTTKPRTPISGSVTLLDGQRRIRSFQIRAADGGRVRAKMPDLARGKHQISVRYGGSATVAASRTGTVTVTMI